ncbi:TolC family protein [Methylophaga sp. OBS3]|uniref:TolC family protein n=1 Tax=Methylophaga sp. OBS3 TaxID=2991934 RepID=UPI00224E5836|nr:TolC family protein [Methylophaga sp. OBS3]MCX4189221.1 TolC family protein [Methylophaga sp. OBS3]
MRSALLMTAFMAVATPLTTSVVMADTPITLKTLTTYVYNQAPAKQGEASLQQLSDARKNRASTLFADAATISFNHYNDGVGSGDGLREYESAVSMPLWLPGQKRQQQNWSQEIANQLPYYQQRLRLQASGIVRQHVWQVMQAAAQVRQADSTLENAQSILDSVSLRVEGSDLPETELLLAQSHLLSMKNNRQHAQNQLQQAMNQYFYQTGQRELPADVEESLSAQRNITVEHPILAELSQQVTTLRSEMQNARYANAVNPSVSVGVKRERGAGNEPFNNSLGLGLTLALGDKPYSEPAIAEAAKAMSDIEIERQQIKRQLEAQLLAQLDQLASQQAQQDMLKAQYDISSAYLERQKKSFEFGQIDLMTLLRVEAQTYNDRAQIQMLEISIGQTIAEINQTLGVTL